MKTIVAIFDDISVARQVVEDLVKANFVRHSISLITNDGQNQYNRFLDKDYAPRVEAVTPLEGAGIGTVVGALTGFLLNLMTVVIPSLTLGISPIASSVIGAVVGALIGAVIGAVIKISVPEDESQYYAEAIKRGATLISIRTDTPRQAEEVMNRYGTINLHERISQWRQTGWIGFDGESEIKAADTAPWEILNVITRETISTTVSPIRPVVDTNAGLLAEPMIETEDTERLLAIPEQEVEILSPKVNLEPSPLFHEQDAAPDQGVNALMEPPSTYIDVL